MKKLIYILLFLGILSACGTRDNTTGLKEGLYKSTTPRALQNDSWRQVGQIEAFDEDGDALEFSQADGRVTPFFIDKCGMIVVKDEDKLEVGRYRLKVLAREIYTKERYEVQATIEITVIEGQPPTEELPIALLGGSITCSRLSDPSNL